MEKVLNDKLHFAKLTSNASSPSKGSTESAGLDLYSAYDYQIQPSDKVLALTDIQIIEFPVGCYGRVAPRSGLAHKNFIDVGAGVIDRDYRGNIGILLFNFSKNVFNVTKGDRIAQLICERITCPEIEEHPESIISSCVLKARGCEGFGSTGK